MAGSNGGEVVQVNADGYFHKAESEDIEELTGIQDLDERITSVSNELTRCPRLVATYFVNAFNLIRVEGICMRTQAIGRCHGHCDGLPNGHHLWSTSVSMRSHIEGDGPTVAPRMTKSSRRSVRIVAYLVTIRPAIASTTATMQNQETTLTAGPWCAAVFHNGASAAVIFVDVVTSPIGGGLADTRLFTTKAMDVDNRVCHGINHIGRSRAIGEEGFVGLADRVKDF